MLYTTHKKLCVPHLIKQAEPATPSYSTAVLGGKGFHLCEMDEMGLPVPEAIIIPTTYCVDYMDDPNSVDVKGLARTILKSLKGAEIGVYSVRSGAPVSMPGMMDTILNVGIYQQEPWVGSSRAYYDCRRRFLEMYGTVALGLSDNSFTSLLHPVQEIMKVNNIKEMSTTVLRGLCDKYEGVYSDHLYSLPSNEHPVVILANCIKAVFDSWNTPRAIAYRDANGISHNMGTAVVIQRMVYGNLNDNSCSGVMFTGNPNTGDGAYTGEYLPNAQGEDVVAGTHTPFACFTGIRTMKDWNASVADDLLVKAATIHTYYGCMQDIEFTVEDGRLFILQTRDAKVTGSAKANGLLASIPDNPTKEDIKAVLTPKDYRALSGVTITANCEPTFTGLPASSGAVSGVIVHTLEQALEAKGKGILVVGTTTPDDFPLMMECAGFVTTCGGMTSHAAVVARGMGIPCVVGCSDGEEYLDDNYAGKPIHFCGETGRVWVNATVYIEHTSAPVSLSGVLFGGLSEVECLVSEVGDVLCMGMLPIVSFTSLCSRGPLPVELRKLKEAHPKKPIIIDCTLPNTQYSDNLNPFATGDTNPLLSDEVIEDIRATLSDSSIALINVPDGWGGGALSDLAPLSGVPTDDIPTYSGVLFDSLG